MNATSLPLSFRLTCLTFPLIAWSLAGCEADTEPGPGAQLLAQVSDNYAEIVYANYVDTAASARALSAEIESFLAQPSQEGLTEARRLWRAAREPYLQTEPYRFYGGPIDDPDNGPEGMLNGWPLDEAYIDYVTGDESAGIVNDAGAELSAERLMALNEQGGEANIATGYHAIEFLLWGQDDREDGPGDRPVSDYIDAENADRRAQYLRVVTDLLVSQLEGLEEAWAPKKKNYRAEFAVAPGLDSLANILTGMIILSGFETGGERIQTALQSGEQEDEHSCFSDNTHRDMIGDIQGVLNVFLGTYLRLDGSKVSGPGVRDVVRALDTDLASSLEDQIRMSLQLAEAIEPPFDQEIAVGNEAGRRRLEALASSLRAQEKILEEVFLRLDLSIPSEK